MELCGMGCVMHSFLENDASNHNLHWWFMLIWGGGFGQTVSVFNVSFNFCGPKVTMEANYGKITIIINMIKCVLCLFLLKVQYLYFQKKKERKKENRSNTCSNCHCCCYFIFLIFSFLFYLKMFPQQSL